MTDRTIVVGYNGSASAHSTLVWALDEAARHRLAVHLAYVVDGSLGSEPRGPMPRDDHRADGCSRAQAVVDRGLTEATAQPEVTVTGSLMHGRTTTVLCDLSSRADMLVVGSRPGGPDCPFVSTVSLAVATHAHCPVVVVRAGHNTRSEGRPVAVGIDESTESQRAVGFAFEEAAVHGAPVLAVHAWTPPTTPWRSDVRPLVADVAELETTERLVMSRAVNAWRDKYPDVPVVTRLMPANARHALANVSHDAQLLVIGSRGQGAVAGLRIISVSRYVLHHASCPVAVIHSRAA